MHETFSLNAQYLADLKNEWNEGIGLTKRKDRHPEPHSNPELRVLLEVYKSYELHLFRQCHYYNEAKREVNQNVFSLGLVNLENGKLRKWIDETTRIRDPTREKNAQEVIDTLFADIGETGEENSEGGDDNDNVILTNGHILMEDEQLIIEFEEEDDDEVDSDSGDEVKLILD
ncbi:hypothetical protein C8Q75DRAFT_731928 [Abortiporus biennis]|nr:hypothetical protein C8Q75DRAFT_731928 [Abortiporus biennis]